MALTKNTPAVATSRSIDWILFLAVLPIIAAGLVTMYSFENKAPKLCDVQEASAVETPPEASCATEQLPAPANT